MGKESEEQRYQILFRNMINGLALYELKLDDTDKPTSCICLEVNPAFEKITGISSSSIVGREITNPLGETTDDSSSFLEKCFRVVLQGESLEFEHYSRNTDKHLSIHSFILGENRLAAIITDITETVIARKEMEKRDWQLETIVNHTEEVFYIHDNNGNMEFISPLSTNIFGHSLENLRERWETIATDNPINLLGREKTRIALENGIKQDPYLLEINDSSGNPRYVEIDESPFLDSNGNVSGITGAIRDVTNRVRVENEREALQKQLLQSQKMEAIGRLAGGVAHDFNNLMTVVTGYCDILMKKFENSGLIVKEIEEIRNAGISASQLTRQLLAFSRKQVLDLKVFDLFSEIGNTEKMLRRLIGEDIYLSVTSRSESYLIRADRSQIQQILVNLAVNSRDAMPGGGEIEIEVSSVEIDDQFADDQENVTAGEFVLLEFRDNGIGMSNETASRIFEPFFTTKEPGRGTGLGLSTVYGIVAQLEGFLLVNSELAQGTAMKIYFPALHGEAVYKEKPDTVRSTCSNYTVLLTEDDHEVRGVVKAMLEILGAKVFEAENGLKAIELVKGNTEEFDLLLTDVIMPGMSGIELVEEIRKQNANMKILFMSGYTDNALQYKDIINDDFALIEKPFDVNSLSRKIDSVLTLKHITR